jgi:excisionase family DNA binding protein
VSEKEELSITDVARELGANERTVRRWIKAGELDASKDIFGRYRITRAALNDFIRQRRERYNEDDKDEDS